MPPELATAHRAAGASEIIGWYGSQVWSIEVTLTGDSDQREEGITACIGQRRSHPMRLLRLADCADRPVRGHPFPRGIRRLRRHTLRYQSGTRSVGKVPWGPPVELSDKGLYSAVRDSGHAHRTRNRGRVRATAWATFGNGSTRKLSASVARIGDRQTSEPHLSRVLDGHTKPDLVAAKWLSDFD